MSSIGDKLKGATQVVHGVGENIRGTILGAVDKVARTEGEIKGDAIAQRGREEMDKGMANMGYRAPAASQPNTDTRAPTVPGNTNQVDGTSAYPLGSNGAVGTEKHSMPSEAMPSGTYTSDQYPKQDAMSNEPDAMKQHEPPDYQSQPELGAYNQSQSRSSDEKS